MANTTADKLNKLKETKTAIRDAIIAKGVDVPEGTVFSDYTGKIGEIDISLPELTNPAAASDVCETKEFINANGEKVTGNVIETSSPLPIYNNGNGYISYRVNDTHLITQVTPLSSMLLRGLKGSLISYKPLSDFGDALPEDVAAGKTFSSANGLKITGTAEFGSGSNLPELSYPATSEDVAEGKQFINENGEKVSGSVMVLAGIFPLPDEDSGNVSYGRYGNSLEVTLTINHDMIIKGNFGGFSGEIPLSDFGDATAADVAAGKTFTSADGLKVTGTNAVSQSAVCRFGTSSYPLTLYYMYNGTFEEKSSETSLIDFYVDYKSLMVLVIPSGENVRIRTSGDTGTNYLSPVRTYNNEDGTISQLYNASAYELEIVVASGGGTTPPHIT